MESALRRQKEVDELLQVFHDYQSSRAAWAEHAQLNREYRYGRQYTQEEITELENRGRSTAIDNRLHPAVETGKALLTSSRPRYKALARESSDSKVANVVEGLLEFHWDVSNGTMHLRNIVDDYYTVGAGYAFIYIDPEADRGKGEVFFTDLDPLDVYIDPYSRDRLCDDAEHMVISRKYTRSQAKRLLKRYSKLIDKDGSTDLGVSEEVVTNRYDGMMTHWPSDISGSAGITGDDQEVRLYRFFSKEEVSVLDIYQTWDGGELTLYGDDIRKKMASKVWMINGIPITDKNYFEILAKEMMDVYLAELEEAKMGGAPVPEAPEIVEITYGELIQSKGEVVSRQETRIKETAIIGSTLLYKRILETDKYPIVPFFNMHTRTPYPTSDVAMSRGLQDWINTINQLIIAHTQQATNLKVLLPSGSVDMEEFERRWATPGVGIEVDMEDGMVPIVVQPIPLPNELFMSKQSAASAIDDQFGIYRLMAGDSSAAPATNSATLNIDHFGQRKSKSKLADIEEALRRCAQIAFRYMQALYTSEKKFRVVNHNNHTTEYAINSGLVDEKAEGIAAVGSIANLNYDIQIVSGSTLPTNYMAQLEMHMQLYNGGLLDRTEVWKNTPIYDAEGLAKRFGEIQTLQQQLESAEEQIKSLKGDMQTRDREVKHLKDEVEVGKTRRKLDQISSMAQADKTIGAARIADTVSQIDSAVKERLKPDKEKK